MQTINVTSDATERVWDPTSRAYRDAHANLSGTIPAPIDDEALFTPQQIEATDQVMVHAMGSWYPATVVGTRPKSGKLEVEYTSGTGTTRRKTVDRSHLVPPGCGYPTRQDVRLAEQWAAAVWRALEAFRAPRMTIITKATSYPHSAHAATMRREAADELVTVQESMPAPAGEPIP